MTETVVQAETFGVTKLASEELHLDLLRLKALNFSATVQLRNLINHRAAPRAPGGIESLKNLEPAHGSAVHASCLLRPLSSLFADAKARPWNDLGHSWEKLFVRASFQKQTTIHAQAGMPRNGQENELDQVRRVLFRSSDLLDDVFTYYR